MIKRTRINNVDAINTVGDVATALKRGDDLPKALAALKIDPETWDKRLAKVSRINEGNVKTALEAERKAAAIVLGMMPADFGSQDVNAERVADLSRLKYGATTTAK